MSSIGCLSMYMGSVLQGLKWYAFLCMAPDKMGIQINSCLISPQNIHCVYSLEALLISILVYFCGEIRTMSLVFN